MASTGYPLVDAAMRQIRQSGYMHNRLRMVTASFLVKDLGVDWRRGEQYFADQLNDFDFAANNGGWQWAASTGCDAQPYFRIFNPVTQSEKFDPNGQFIRKYLPELARLPDKYLHAPWTAPDGRAGRGRACDWVRIIRGRSCSTTSPGRRRWRATRWSRRRRRRQPPGRSWPKRTGGQRG